MTVLDSFIAFASTLPPEQREVVDEALVALMDQLSGEHDFSAAEVEEIERRIAESNPEYADPADITRIFGKPFSA
jgi:hypothetical protein